MKQLRKIIQNVLSEDIEQKKFDIEDFKKDLSIILKNAIKIFKRKSTVLHPLTDNYIIHFFDKTDIQLEFASGIPFDIRLVSYSSKKGIGESESQIVCNMLKYKWYNNFFKIYKNLSAKSGEAIFNLYVRSLGFKIKEV